MLRIIIAILEALFGIESEAEAPPTRRQARPPRAPRRPAAPGGAGSAGADGEKPTTLEDVFKRLLGIEDEPPPARPVRRQPQPAENQPPQPARDPQPVTSRPPVTPPRPVLRPIPAVPAAEAPAPAAASNPARSFARRLRGNRAAAREAFISAEIFGAPMADRRPGGGRP